MEQRRRQLRTVILLLTAAMMLATTSAQAPAKSSADDGDFSNVNNDGSFDFGYNNKDRGASYHLAQGNRANVVHGRFGSRDPTDDIVKETVYSAGPRGFRARGPHIHRRMDLDQRPRGPIGNKDDPYFDPSEDPSYSFGFKTNTYEKQENANIRGDVTGRYSFVDDVGERHNVEYIAGKDTGFHVKTAFPDSNPGSIGPLYFNAPLVRGEKKQRGRTSVQRGLDGSYRFISAGPDQRRTESSDSSGNVRGSYSYLDDKGSQRTVHYIAGPGIGYRIIKNSKDPFIPSFFPVLPDYRDPALNKPFPTNAYLPDNTFGSDKDDDIFGRPEGSAASGHVKPPKNNRKPIKPPENSGNDDGDDLFDKGNGNNYGSGSQEKPGFGSDSKRPGSRPASSSGGGDSSVGSNEGYKGKPGSDGDDANGYVGKPANKPNNKPTHSKPTSGSSSEKVKPDYSISGNKKPNSGEEEDIFGEDKPSEQNGGRKPEGGNNYDNKPGAGRPNKPGGSSESNGPEGPSGRPGTRPGGRPNKRPVDRPGVRPGERPFKRPGERPFNRPGERPFNRPGNRPSGRPENRPSSGDQDRPNTGLDDGADDIFGKPVKPAKKPSKPSTVSRPGNNKIDKDDKGRPGSGDDGDNDDDIFGTSQSGGNFNNKYPNKSDKFPNIQPGGSSNKHPNKPDSFESTKPGSSGETEFSSSSGSGPDGPIRPDIGTDTGPSSSGSPTSGSAKPIGPPLSGGFLDEDGKGGVDKGGHKKNDVIYSHPGGDTEITFGGPGDKLSGGTIFTNLGEESIHFPPGKSVRAHVQSIDLLPYGTKVPSPAEAIDEELKKHGSR